MLEESERVTDLEEVLLIELREGLKRMDALLTRLEGIIAALVPGTGMGAPSGASGQLPTNIIGPYWSPRPQTPEEKKAEDEAIQKIIEKALSERQEPPPLAD